MFVVDKSRNEISSLPATEIKLSKLKHLNSKVASSILKELGKEENYPRAIAKKLKIDEQIIYYHIRNLEKAGMIEVVKKEKIQGSFANFYGLKQPAFVVKFKEFENTRAFSDIEKSQAKFLHPFIEDGQFNATIIIGSPDPHGPEKARSRDGYYAIDLSLFFGTFLSYSPNPSVKLDTEIKTEDLDGNLIVVGGPVVNSVTGKLNPKLSIKFEKDNHWALISSISEKTYTSDDVGIIIKTKNPFNPKKSLLLIAGKRHGGTKAAIIAFLKHFTEISKGNKFNSKIYAKVVEGIDMNSDGVVDDVEILE